jgi:DNA-binding transcriptional MerR regulator
MAEKILIGEAARRLKCSTVTLKKWEQKGCLKGYRDHRGWRYYDAAEIERLLAERQSEPHSVSQANSSVITNEMATRMGKP